MKKLVNVLVILAAVCFALGTLLALSITVLPLPGWSPETYWRGFTGLLLFAMTLMMMQRWKE